MRGEHTETVKEHHEVVQTVGGQEQLAAEDIRLDLPSAYCVLHFSFTERIDYCGLTL